MLNLFKNLNFFYNLLCFFFKKIKLKEFQIFFLFYRQGALGRTINSLVMRIGSVRNSILNFSRNTLLSKCNITSTDVFDLKKISKDNLLILIEDSIDMGCGVFLLKEELKGNKIIQWTPFPIIPKEMASQINTNFPAVSQRMNVFKSFPGHLNGVTSIDFNPKKAIIGTASDDKTWKLWKFPTGELLMHGEGHKDWISCISFHPNGILLATCGGDAAIKLWNILEEKCVYTIIDHAEPVWKCKFHFGGDFMLTCCLDHTIRLYDLNNYKARMSYRAHLDSVNSINWVPMSNSFVSGSADKTCSLWDMRTNICAQTYYGHNNAINCCAVDPTGNVLASCDADGIVKFWDLRTVRELASIDECKQAANCLCFDRTGDQLAVGYDDSNIRLFKTGQKYETMFKGHDDAVLDLMYDPNNVLLISASADRTFKIWQ